MAMKYLVFLFLLGSLSALSQDYYEDEKIYKEVEKQRKYVLTLLSEERFSEIKKEDLMVENISAVNMYERVLIYGLIGDFSTFIPEYLSTYSRFYMPILPKTLRQIASSHAEYDYIEWLIGVKFNSEIFRIFKKHEELIKRNIENSILSDEEKLFVQGALISIIVKKDNCNIIAKEQVDIVKRTFESTYPNSIYKKYVERAFYEKYIPGKWAFGAYVEGGVIFPDGKLSQYITPGSNIEVGYAIYYDRFILTGMFGAGGLASIKKTFHEKVDWLEGDNIMYGGGSLTLGYEVLGSSFIHIAPYAGIGGYGLGPSSNTESGYYDGVENLSPHAKLIAGMRVDFEFTRDRCSNKYIFGDEVIYHESIHRLIRLNVGFTTPQYNKLVPGLQGNLWFAKLGLGIFGRIPQ
jgi:hypothetical protein